MGKCFSVRVIKAVFHMDRRESMERKMVKKQDRKKLTLAQGFPDGRV